MRRIVTSEKIDAPSMASGAELRCPRCGSANLHHLTVTIFNRAEDEVMIWRTAVEHRRVETTQVVSLETENPSPRRHGMTIKFECEECCRDPATDVLELNLWQHKGATLLNWRYAEIGSAPKV